MAENWWLPSARDWIRAEVERRICEKGGQQLTVASQQQGLLLGVFHCEL
jgi:hypothetical protein